MPWFGPAVDPLFSLELICQNNGLKYRDLKTSREAKSGARVGVEGNLQGFEHMMLMIQYTL